jgi:serine phosphatase RsbU (regulator of sigma subunit)
MSNEECASGAPAVHGGGTVAVDGAELELAQQVQRLLFPKSSPLCTWCCIGVKNRIDGMLGGDYYDFIDMPDGCQALFVGDVTGHGLHASVVMSLIYGFIHHAALGSCDPHTVVQEVNSFLLHFSQRSQTVDQYFSSTLFFGIINPSTLLMTYVNAGHPPALVRRGEEVIELCPTAQPVGFFDAIDIEVKTFQFLRDDRLLLYTDGIIEAANPVGELFGMARLQQELLGDGSDHMVFLETLFGGLERFGIPDPPEDDCTALVVDIHGLLGMAD